MRRSDAEFFQMIARRNLDEVDLRQIVVFCGQPEDGNSSGFFRQHGDGQSFEYNKHRAAAQSDLLAGNDGGSAISESLNVFQRPGAASKLAVLALQNFRHLLPPRLGITNVLEFVLPPVGKGWRARIEVAHFLKMMEKIQKKRRAVRNARKWQTVGFH